MVYYNKNIYKERLSLRNPLHFLATGFGTGLISFIPGTIGSLSAIPLWWLMTFLSLKIYLLILLISVIIGIYLCHRTSCDIGIHDHSSIVWDEFIGIWITLMMIPCITWQWILLGFIIFRIIDCLKPWPICWLDKNVSGGIGIMIDDIIAGMIAAIIIYNLGK
ncbi:phosphatidylglycerophosphatase A [Pantoea sp. Mhis]|uniref:phosphatidylglycerophosphatase A n=1 Tax=Pantoea sp. Mhis TaxID=2576759 RepID=UPI00351AD682